MVAASTLNRLCSSREVITSAGNVMKTFLMADLIERVREMATKQSRAAVKPLSMASMMSGADTDESDDNGNNGALSNESGGEEHRFSLRECDSLLLGGTV